MTSLQCSDWSPEAPSAIHERPSSIVTKAWEEEGPTQSSKPARRTPIPWSVGIKSLILGALIGGIALAVVLTLWLRLGSAKSTTLSTTMRIAATTNINTTTSTITTSTSTSSASTTSISTTTSSTSTSSTSTSTSTTSSTSTSTATTSTSTTSTSTSTSTTSTSTKTTTTSVTTVTSTTSTSTSTTTSATTTTTQFSTGWNASGITVAGVTDSSGVGSNQLYHPYCLVLDSSNTIFVADQNNQRVQRWAANATTGTTVAGASNGATGGSLNLLSYPSDLAIDGSDNVYVVDGGNQRVVFWTQNATAGTIVAGTGSQGSANNQLSNPSGLYRDPTSGTLYISDSGNHRVMQYLSGASSGTVVAGGNGAGTASNQLNNPRGLYFDPSTNSLLIANNLAHNIVRWVVGASTWTLITGSSSGVTGTTSTMLSYPTDVTLDWMGNMYVSDEGNQRIQFFLAGQSNGTTIAGVTGVSGNTSQLLYTPSSLAVDSQFNVYVVEYNNHRVHKFLHY